MAIENNNCLIFTLVHIHYFQTFYKKPRRIKYANSNKISKHLGIPIRKP